MSRYGARKKSPDYPISEESAIDSVNALLEYYDIDVEALLAGDGDKAKQAADAFEKSLDHVMRAFRAGTLSAEENKDGKLVVTQKLGSGEELEYKEINARAKLAMEKFSTDAGYSRIYSFMGSLCGLGKTGIEKLGPKDLAVVEVLGTVFSNA